MNGEAFVVNDPEPTGREVLVLAGLTPPGGTRSGLSLPARNREGSNSTKK